MGPSAVGPEEDGMTRPLHKNSIPIGPERLPLAWFFTVENSVVLNFLKFRIGEGVGE